MRRQPLHISLSLPLIPIHVTSGKIPATEHPAIRRADHEQPTGHPAAPTKLRIQLPLPQQPKLHTNTRHTLNPHTHMTQTPIRTPYTNIITPPPLPIRHLSLYTSHNTLTTHQTYPQQYQSHHTSYTNCHPNPQLSSPLPSLSPTNHIAYTNMSAPSTPPLSLYHYA